MRKVVALRQDSPPWIHDLPNTDISKNVAQHTMQYAAPLKGLDNRVESTYHGVAPAYSGLTVLPNSCSADHIALCFDRAASKESLPMSCTSPDCKGARVCQHVRSSCPQNLCGLWKPDIIASQKANYAQVRSAMMVGCLVLCYGILKKMGGLTLSSGCFNGIVEFVSRNCRVRFHYPCPGDIYVLWVV